MTWGVLLSRGQPFHKGHIEIIKKALNENDKVLVVIGSADKSGVARNPLDIYMRERMFEKMRSYICTDRLDFISLKDLSNDEDIPYESAVGSSNTSFELVNSEWGSYLYYNIIARTGEKTFNLYYNDAEEIVSAWFNDTIRDRIIIESVPRIDGYSSSEVRLACKADNMNYLCDALCYLTLYEIDDVKDIINQYQEV